MSLSQILDQLEIVTQGQGFTDLTPELNTWISKSGLIQGVLHITTMHTSCSLTINENADPRVLEDLSIYMSALVPEEGFRPISGSGPKRSYLHSDEGPDDMPAHIRTALTCCSLSLSIDCGALLLGTWQAVYLWEHRSNKHLRKINLHALGEIEPPTQKSSKASTANLLTKRNGHKLNELVKARNNAQTMAKGEGSITDVDLLIDRLHQLADEDILRTD